MAKLTKEKNIVEKKTSAQILLELSGSWKDSRSAEVIVAEIRRNRKNSRTLETGFKM